PPLRAPLYVLALSLHDALPISVHSIPRLMQGQGVIVGVGAMDYPAQFQGASPATLAELAVSKVMTLTSTYDHRIIQGAASGEFLKRIGDKLLGKDGFYD